MLEIIPNWHPVVVHFTIALLSVSIGFYIMAIILKNNRLYEQWLMFANWSLWLGAGFAILTAIAGWFAYNGVAHDTPSHEAMTTHRNWALATLAVFLILAIWSFTNHRKGIKPAILFLIVGIAGSGLLATTGWLGAEAVYRYGLGVMSLPKAEGEGHSHSHGNNVEHNDGHSSEGNNDEKHGNKENLNDQQMQIDKNSAHSHEHGSDDHAQ